MLKQGSRKNEIDVKKCRNEKKKRKITLSIAQRREFIVSENSNSSKLTRALGWWHNASPFFGDCHESKLTLTLGSLIRSFGNIPTVVRQREKKTETHQAHSPRFTHGLQWKTHFKFLTRLLCMHKSLLRECLQMSICWLAAALFPSTRTHFLSYSHAANSIQNMRKKEARTKFQLRMFCTFRWCLFLVNTFKTMMIFHRSNSRHINIQPFDSFVLTIFHFVSDLHELPYTFRSQTIIHRSIFVARKGLQKARPGRNMWKYLEICESTLCQNFNFIQFDSIAWNYENWHGTAKVLRATFQKHPKYVRNCATIEAWFRTRRGENWILIWSQPPFYNTLTWNITKFNARRKSKT